MEKTCTIGIDFGTLSARAVALDLTSGVEIAQAEFMYPHGVMDRQLPDGTPLPPRFALQHPQDYLDAIGALISELLQTVDKEQVVGVGLDFTSCTVLCADENGTPLCFKPEFQAEPHAYVKLWKHHGAIEESQILEQIARQRKEQWLEHYGGSSSSEAFFPKVLETARKAPAVFAATHRFYEAGDWLCSQLTGWEVHNTCMVGLKSYWTGSYPDNAFFCQADPCLDGILGGKVSARVDPQSQIAGYLNAQGAVLTGLREGTPVAMPIADAHAAMPALNVTQCGQCALVVGTSGVLLINAEAPVTVPGICSQAPGGIYPDLCTVEAGLASLGDCFDWFVTNCVPENYRLEAGRQGIGIHAYLRQKVAALGPSRLIALDWFSGNRSILKNDRLSGMILGLTMQTRPEEIYRALIEATAFAIRVILENFADHGIPVDTICVTGGIASKDPLLMQIYADVLKKPLSVGHDPQAAARGSAIYGAVASGNFASVREAAAFYAKPPKQVYNPNEKNARAYDVLYAQYKRLYNYFGKENPVMETLADFVIN